MGLFTHVIPVVILAVAVSYFSGIRQFEKQSIIISELKNEYDYIIVGGGAAGSILAARLSEDKDNNVLLLEAGGHYDEQPASRQLINWVFLAHTEHDWDYYTEPQEFSNYAFNGNRAYWPRGRVLGGSATINLAQYFRGSKYDYDDWAANGCTGWSHKDVLSYFLKSEDIQIDELKASKYHSSGGPIAVSQARVTPLADMYLRAGQELGYKVINDYSSEDPEGFSSIQLMVRNGIRSNVGVEYLQNTADRGNLHIAINSFVTKIDIKNKQARGVYFIRDGRKHFIKARKEVIVSAGAINTPQLLMLSGIGPKDHLAEHGIDIVADLPVGENLQDHLAVPLITRINSSIGITENLVNSFWTKFKYLFSGKGPIATAGVDGSAFLYIDEKNKGNKGPELQLNFFSGYPFINTFSCKQKLVDEYFAKHGNVNGFSTIVANTHPEVRGELKLRSRDPFDYPSLNPRYLSQPKDVQDLIKGIRIWEKLMETPSFQSLGVSFDDTKLSFCSEHPFRSDAYWECFVRHMATTSYHVCCTAKMGHDNDPSAVVNPQLRVKGIKGLRVVDTSVFPNVTVGNTQAPTMMLAEKLADEIRGIDSVKDIRRQLGL